MYEFYIAKIQTNCQNCATESMPHSDPQPPSDDLQDALRGLGERNESLARELETLKGQIKVLARKLYGPKREKLDPNQLQLLIDGLISQINEQSEALAESANPPEAKLKGRKARKHPGRRPLPEELRRLRIVQGWLLGPYSALHRARAGNLAQGGRHVAAVHSGPLPCRTPSP